MNKSTLSEMRSKSMQAIKDIRNGKITLLETDEIYKEFSQLVKEYKLEIGGSNIKPIEALKDSRNTSSKSYEMSEELIVLLKNIELDISNYIPIKQQKEVEIVKGLSAEHKDLANKIKSKIRKTAELIVEIGEEISSAVKDKPSKYKELFYDEIGMSRRSALRYQQIANHAKIQELKSNSGLEGKTMTDLLVIMAPEQDNNSQKINVHNVAKSFYNRYKDDKDSLKAIIDELQKLINMPR